MSSSVDMSRASLIKLAGALVAAEVIVWIALWQIDGLEWMWHVPVLAAAVLTVRSMRGGGFAPLSILAGVVAVIGGMLFFSGGLLASLVAIVWLAVVGVVWSVVRARRANAGESL